MSGLPSPLMARGRPSRTFSNSLDTLEDSFHGAHACDVIPGAVISATLTLRQPLPAPHIGVARASAAEVDERGQLLFSLERREFRMMALHDIRHTAIEVRRG